MKARKLEWTWEWQKLESSIVRLADCSCVMLSVCPSTAVLAQATELGKKRKISKEVKLEKEKKKRKRMAEEMKNAQEVEEQASPMIEGPAASQEPEPTGPEKMAKRAAELRKKSLEAKEGREKALKAETELLEAAEKAEKGSNEKAAD